MFFLLQDHKLITTKHSLRGEGKDKRYCALYTRGGSRSVLRNC